ncbi:MAG: LacI family DNA-binding transcriptional regulator [Propionicimonas sp.]|nr:LacI family DNA-binding transcriptional regulator [Propionicimonas sp.]
MAGRVQIRDVAQRAGVSIGTVSNVINGLGTVKARNVERVEQAMAELGFVPNSHARQLRTGRGDAIGLVVLSVSNPFYAEIAHVAETFAEEHGSTIVIGSSDHDEAREQRYIDLFEASRSRGLLVAPVSGITPRLLEVRRRGTPVVLLHEHVSADDFCSVSLDGVAGGYLACRHLIDIGRRRIALVGGPVSQISDRVSGASQAIREAADSVLTFLETTDLSVEEGREAANRILALPRDERPDAVFGANDTVALGVLQEFILRGIKVPQDIALIGYDDIDFAATAIVPLSSVAQPREQIAREAIRLLIDEEREGSHTHEQALLVPELVVRASTTG